MLNLLLLLGDISSQRIAFHQDITGAECWPNMNDLNSTDLRCNAFCSLNCTCILDDVNVTSNCTDGIVKVSQVWYPSNVRFLSWADSVLHIIKPRSFLKFGSTLEKLYLNNINLQHLEPGVFAGLLNLQKLGLEDNMLEGIPVGIFSRMTKLEWLDLKYNKIHRIEIGAFDRLLQLQLLYLNGNVLSEIQVGMFRQMNRLIRLDIAYNTILRHMAGAFETLENLITLRLTGNMLSEIHVGSFKGLIKLEKLSLGTNMIYVIEAGAFKDSIQLNHIFLSGNMITEIREGVFSGLMNLVELYVERNLIHKIEAGAFSDLENLPVLSVSNNDLSTLHPETFQNVIKLDILVLANNKLEYLPENIFYKLSQLHYLSLAFNNLHRIPATLFLHSSSLETLDLQGNVLLWIEHQALVGLKETVTFIVSSFSTCCFTSANCLSPAPESPFLTCKRLLPFNVLRIGIWFVCSLAILGNIFVLYYQFKHRQHGNKIQLFLITNLSISDFFMGIYLISLLSADLYYKDYFPSHSEAWRKSMLCRIVGALSVLSSEASTFIITLVTIDRFLGVKYTLSKFRLSVKSARIIVTLLWLVAFGIAITVFVLSKRDSDIYAVSEICVGLPISRSPFHKTYDTTIQLSSIPWNGNGNEDTFQNSVNDGSRVAAFFSIAIFTGLNLICFFIIGYCYLSIFIYIRRTTKESGRSPNLNQEIRIATKMSLIVLTDFCCWVPVGLLSILVQAGIVKVNPVAYAWIATFVLPINSSINPVLYTFSSLVLDKMKSSSTNGRMVQKRINKCR